MKIVKKISLAELKVMASLMFGELFKADVDETLEKYFMEFAIAERLNR